MKTLLRTSMLPLPLFGSVTELLAEHFQQIPNQTHPMKLQAMPLKSFLASAILCAATLITNAQITPLRSYAISGIDYTRSYDAATGWSYATNDYVGTLDFLSPTNARLTKVYPDGAVGSHALILTWYFDPTIPTQGGMAVELSDPNDPVIKRTTYNLSLQFDGVKNIVSGNFMTRAWMSVLPGFYDWFNVAYGDFAGVEVPPHEVASPLGSYDISGSETSKRTTVSYTGTLTLSSPTTGQLTRNYADGTTTTVNLALDTPLNLLAATQTITAAQVENASGENTNYTLDLQLNGLLYSVDSVYTTTKTKGRKTSTVSSGAFTGAQP